MIPKLIKKFSLGAESGVTITFGGLGFFHTVAIRFSSLTFFVAFDVSASWDIPSFYPHPLWMTRI